MLIFQHIQKEENHFIQEQHKNYLEMLKKTMIVMKLLIC